MTPPITVAVPADEARRLNQFLEDQQRARQRIAYLEQQAQTFTRAGKTVPAAASMRTARLVAYLWALEGEQE